jgi:hypothetical protein
MTPHEYLEFTCPSAEAAWDLIDDSIKAYLNAEAKVAKDKEDAEVAFDEGQMEAAFMRRCPGLI